MTDQRAWEVALEFINELPPPAEGHTRMLVLHLDRPSVAGNIQSTVGATEISGVRGLNIRDSQTHPIGDGRAYTVLDVENIITADGDHVMERVGVLTVDAILRSKIL